MLKRVRSVFTSFFNPPGFGGCSSVVPASAVPPSGDWRPPLVAVAFLLLTEPSTWSVCIRIRSS